jgi:hypothetical protein
MPSTFHVVQGLAVAGTLREALDVQPGEILANEDLLSCGPLAPLRSIDEWAQVRRAYWDSVAPGRDDEIFNPDLLANGQAIREARSIFVWLGTGVADQLLLAWIPQLLKLVDSGAQLSLVQFDQFGKRNIEAWSLGFLNVDHLRDHPVPEQVSPTRLAELEGIWTLLTSHEPVGLVSLLSGESASFPFMHPALQPLVERYPDRATGLGRWDAELLRRVKENGPSAVRVIGHTLGNNIDSDLVGDGYLFSRLRQLADPKLPYPLVSLAGDATSMRNCQVTVTEAGEAVLRSEANAVALNGIDDWVLGVHLTSERLWYRSGGAIAI